MKFSFGLQNWAMWDVLYPSLCENCGEPLRQDDILFCSRCWSDAPIVETKDMPKFKHLDYAVSAYLFTGDNVIRQAVHALKYEAQVQLAETMARRMLLRIPTKFLGPEMVWTPVPQHWVRKMERSFNQSLMLASSLSEICRRDKPSALIRRKRNTPTQTTRTLTERRLNVRDAFSVAISGTVPEHTLLIDDVITTGATVDECARTLKEGGANWVGAYSFALAKHSA